MTAVAAGGDALSGLDESTEYRIARTPDVATITAGAEIEYACRWIGGGNQPQVAGDGQWGARDGVHWYRYSARPPRHFWQNQLQSMHAGFVWRHRWDEDPGFYSVVAVIRSRLAPGALPTRCAVSQQVGETGVLLSESLDDLLRRGDTPPLEAVAAEAARYVEVLRQIERRFPITDARLEQQHDRTVESWSRYAARLADLQKQTAGRRRIPVRALHLETATQARRPLFLFLVDRSQTPQAQRWTLVDWTSADDPRFHGEYDGEGDTVEEAVAAAFTSWDWSNRYPAGDVAYEVPAELRASLGGPPRRRLETNGTNLAEEIVGALGWIAVGAMVVSGVCAVFVAIPALNTAAIATALASSTGAALLSIAERRRQGLFDWRADVIDGLTVATNLLGAGAWARGARVIALDRAGQAANFVFVGARIGADAVQGLLVASQHIDDLEAASKDPELSPDDRARRLLATLGQLTALGALTYLSYRATGSARDHLDTRTAHVRDEDAGGIGASATQLQSVRDRLRAIVDRDGPPLDLTVPPIVEGHTGRAQQGGGGRGQQPRPERTPKPEKHTTTVRIGEGHPNSAQRRKPDDTEFAHAFPEDKSLWRARSFERDQILLEEHEGFVFHAICDQGTLNIEIVTRYDPKKHKALARFFPGVTREIRSRKIKAPVVIPKAYEYFEQVGNPVKKLKGSWAWDNYEDCTSVFYESVKTMDKRAAAIRAVPHARTYKAFHEPRGFTKVIDASHDAPLQQFHFEIEKE